MQKFILATLASATYAVQIQLAHRISLPDFELGDPISFSQLSVPAPEVLDALPYKECMRVAPWYDCKPDGKEKCDLILEGNTSTGPQLDDRTLYLLGLAGCPQPRTGSSPGVWQADPRGSAGEGIWSKPDELALAQNDSFYDRKHRNGADPIFAFSELTGILVPDWLRAGVQTVIDFYEFYQLVIVGQPDSFAMNMLFNLEKHRAIMDLFCTQHECMGDVELMAEAFETINGLTEEDIDIAINVYNIADRHEVVLVEDEKIMNELVQEIADETGLSKAHVQFIIKEADGDFDAFIQLLKNAKQISGRCDQPICWESVKVMCDQPICWESVNMNPLDLIMVETQQLMQAIYM